VEFFPHRSPEETGADFYYHRLLVDRLIDEHEQLQFSGVTEIIARKGGLRTSPSPWTIRRLTSPMARQKGRRRPPVPVLVHFIRALAAETCPAWLRRPAGNRFERAKALLDSIPQEPDLFCGLRDAVVVDKYGIEESHRKIAHPRSCKDHRYAGLRAIVHHFLPLLVEALERKNASILP
jgi:hypothetical protein